MPSHTVVLPLAVAGNDPIDQVAFWRSNRAVLARHRVRLLSADEASAHLERLLPGVGDCVELTGACSVLVQDDPPSRISWSGRPGPHVVFDLQPLARMLQTLWLWEVHDGTWTPFISWLEVALGDGALPASGGARKLRVDRAVHDWASVFGKDKVTVALSGSGRPAGLAIVEESFGIADGMLTLPETAAQRELTLDELLLLEQVDRDVSQEEVNGEAWAAYLGEGTTRALRHGAEPGGGPGSLPDDLLGRVAEVGAQMISALATSGVRVVGDLGELGRTWGAGSHPGASGDRVAMRAAVDVAIGILSCLDTESVASAGFDDQSAAREATLPQTGPSRRPGGDKSTERSLVLEQARSVDLLRVAARRVVRRVSPTPRNGG